MANDDLHGAPGITELCRRLGPGWKCQGTETSTGFFMEVLKDNSSTSSGSIVAPPHCPSFLLSEEQKWKFGTRALVYAFGLIYCFGGLAVITGIYMKALDCIVKHTKKVVRRDPVTGVAMFSEKKIWNATIADITLLALGTSAPQISLAVIDAFQHLGDSSGNELGAGTLLGSTAFNLFVILAVCVVTPKRYQTKSIRDVGVYVVEVAWSFWAYAWLFLILQVWTPNEVTLWEAVATVAQFPILVLHAYIQDRKVRFLSIPWKASETAEAFQELSTICRNPKLAMRYDEASESSAFKANLPFNDGNSDTFEDVDMRSREDLGFLRNRNAVIRQSSLTWEELRLIWRNQFCDAMSVSGTDDGTDSRKVPPSGWQLVIHPLLSYWKISFAFIPPVQLFHGWLAFLCSILFITWISFIVIELSNRFDCVTGLSSYVLALTVLATGTSFPNLVASKIAAQKYENADSAIANINASNCINVYVGFGLPWLISALYSTVFHQRFVVPAEGLGFLLAVYFATAIACIVVLTVRRQLLGGELGGPRRWAWVSAVFFLLLWATFLSFACLVDRFT